ncbi:hypothetical protein [Streptomyces anulatus]|uniref:hypothetical protein n=1 Tax=Streptomyces anulatus TaxID=1892 RepID=UPI0036C140A6
MTLLDVLLAAGAVTYLVLSLALMWGPVLVGLVAVVAWRRLRPTGHHRAARTPGRTCVRPGVRHFEDTRPDPAMTQHLTCEDTCPHVSEDTCPGDPGHEERGAS